MAHIVAFPITNDGTTKSEITNYFMEELDPIFKDGLGISGVSVEGKQITVRLHQLSPPTSFRSASKIRRPVPFDGIHKLTARNKPTNKSKQPSLPFPLHAKNMNLTSWFICSDSQIECSFF